MIKIKQAVIVEGKYDKIKLSAILDTIIIATDGFAVFKDKEKQQLIRRLALARGILVLTDSDSAGFLIRSFIGGCVPQDRIINAYIPDIFGKERRKSDYSKEGKLGVEGVPTQIIISALTKAGVICEEAADTEPRREITKTDLYEDGLSGTAQSKRKREMLLEYFTLPSRLSSSLLIDTLNSFVTYEEYKAAVKIISEKSAEEQLCSE